MAKTLTITSLIVLSLLGSAPVFADSVGTCGLDMGDVSVSAPITFADFCGGSLSAFVRSGGAPSSIVAVQFTLHATDVQTCPDGLGMPTCTPGANNPVKIKFDNTGLDMQPNVFFTNPCGFTLTTPGVYMTNICSVTPSEAALLVADFTGAGLFIGLSGQQSNVYAAFNSATMTTFASVAPEPGMAPVLLLSMGLLAALWRRR